MIRFVTTRPFTVLVACALVAAVALAFATRLELHTDMAELLPANHPAVAALQKLSDHQRLGQSLIVLVESPDRDANLRFIGELRERLAGTKAFAEIDWGPDRALADWKHRWRWLYADVPTLERAEKLLDRAYLQHNPLYLDLDEDDDPKAELEKLELSHPEPPQSGYYEQTLESGIHRVAIMLWRPPHGIGDAGGHAALREVKRAIGTPPPGMTVQLGGHLAQAIEDQDSIRDDLTFATVTCTLLIFGVIWLYFRRLTLVWIVGAPALLGLFVALAIASVTLHALNLNTAFLVAIILGNGINSPIVLLARYGEERATGAEVDAALATAVRSTARGTLAAMGAASIAYGSLAITDFRGFSQFGLLGGAGMLLVWLATFVVVPPLVVVVERRRNKPPRAIGWRGPFSKLARAIAAQPRLAIAAALAFAAAAAVPISHLARDPVEWNLKNLRTPETASRGVWDKAEQLGMTNPDAGYVGSHGALLVDSPDQADAVADALRAQDQQLGPVFSKIRTFRSLLPADQDTKLALLARIRGKIDRRIDALDDKDRDEILKYRPPDDLRTLTTDDLPAIAKRAFGERDGTLGRFVLMSIDSQKYSDWNGHDLLRLAQHLQVDALGKRWTAASPSTVFAGMLETLVRDGPRIALVALAGVVILVLSVLGPARAWRALATQIVALAWFFGVLGALGMKINFFNFVALPITLGVGADYAANLASRLGRERVTDAMAGTGAAVALCSLTTIIGYSSLLVSTNPALRSFGVLADLGEISCLTAALVFLPALSVTRGDPVIDPRAREVADG